MSVQAGHELFAAVHGPVNQDEQSPAFKVGSLLSAAQHRGDPKARAEALEALKRARPDLHDGLGSDSPQQ